MHRTFKFRLYPTAEQAQLMSQFAGVTRFVYNLALEQRAAFWRQYRAHTGGRLNFISQGREVTVLRAEVDWIEAAPAGCLIQALRDLDRAFDNFFAGRKGFPTPRKKGLNDSFRYQGTYISIRQVSQRWGVVWLPKIGWVKYRGTRPVHGKIEATTVVSDVLGWHVCLACAIEHEAPANDNPAIGIDRGIAQTLALSNGETFQLPDLAPIERKIRRAKRKLSRCQRGSNRRARQKARVRRLAGKVARVRRDWQHRVSCSIAERFGTVVFEDLKISNMTARGKGKRGLNRSILNQGWGEFAVMLTYKLQERGGSLIKVPAPYTSQTCSDCGTVDRRSRESQASFVCTACGFRANADHNAAINILRRSTAVMPVEGRGYAPDETGTSRVAA